MDEKLALAIERMGRALGTSMDALGHLTCYEFAPIAEVLILAGHAHLAAMAIMGHGAGDDDEDDVHADLYESGDLEVAMVHVRRVAAELGVAL